MKQLFFLAMMALVPIGTSTIHETPAEQMVYICTGAQSKKYHADKNCRGLNSCSGTIKQISVKDAIDMGRTPCKICYEN